MNQKVNGYEELFFRQDDQRTVNEIEMNFLRVFQWAISRKGALEASRNWNNVCKCIKWTKQRVVLEKLDHELDGSIV